MVQVRGQFGRDSAKKKVDLLQETVTLRMNSSVPFCSRGKSCPVACDLFLLPHWSRGGKDYAKRIEIYYLFPFFLTFESQHNYTQEFT